MGKPGDLNKGDFIRADICSRPNAISGRYKLCEISLELDDTRSKDVFFLETLKMKADLADKMIAEAEEQGKDITDSNVMKVLGKEINALGTPIHQSQSIMTAIFVSLRLMAYYGIAIGIWGLVFKRSFLIFGLYGVIVGLIISLFSVAPVVAFQRTRERIRNIIYGAGLMWGNLGIVIGILGLIALVIQLIFYKH